MKPCHWCDDDSDGAGLAARDGERRGRERVGEGGIGVGDGEGRGGDCAVAIAGQDGEDIDRRGDAERDPVLGGSSRIGCRRGAVGAEPSVVK